jgi:hypothetical protein
MRSQSLDGLVVPKLTRGMAGEPDPAEVVPGADHVDGPAERGGGRGVAFCQKGGEALEEEARSCGHRRHSARRLTG